MIEVKQIDVSLIEAAVAGLNEAQVVQVVLDLAASARNHWIKLAGVLQSTRLDYIHGIQEVEYGNGMAVVALIGMLPNLIEQGMEMTDLHDTLLGPNVPVVPVGERGKHLRKDGGYYRAIPFRHATPTANGSTGAPMGSQFPGMLGEDGARKLGQDVYKAAKKLAASVSDPYKKTSWGGRLPSGMAPKLKPGHATDIFAGMVKMQKTYKKATQNQYITFRTISTGSPGWIRPATQGMHFAEQVGSFVSQQIPQVLAAYFGAAAGGSP